MGLKPASFSGDQGHEGVFEVGVGRFDFDLPGGRQKRVYLLRTGTVRDQADISGADAGVQDRLPSGQFPLDPARLDPGGRGGEQDTVPDLAVKVVPAALVQLAALMKDQDTLAAFGFVQVGRGQEHPDVLVFHELIHDFPQVLPGDRIDAHGRFVQKEQAG